MAKAGDLMSDIAGLFLCFVFFTFSSLWIRFAPDFTEFRIQGSKQRTKKGALALHGVSSSFHEKRFKVLCKRYISCYNFLKK